MKRSALIALVLASFGLAASALAAPRAMTREEIESLAKLGVSYSYWWGHGRWRSDGQSHGSCSGNCPSCTHSGSYGADCSGFVGKCWQVPGDSPITTDAHPYSTNSFYNQSTHWSDVAISAMQLSDAAVHNDGTSGHIVLFQKKGDAGKYWTYEARGCSYGIVHNLRSLSSDYKGIQRDNLTSSTPPEPPDPTPEEVSVMSAVYGDSGGTSDIDGDGKGDICARASAGVLCYLSSGTSFGGSLPGPELSNDNGWNSIEYYSTLRMADINGDGKADVCARSSAGIRCWISQGDKFGEALSGPELSDAAGWKAHKFYSTIRMGDVNGDHKADLCARASDGVHCWLSDGNGFPTEIAGPPLTDALGWDGIDHYSTLRMGDINGDGKDDLCARAAAGMQCWVSEGDKITKPFDGPSALSDAGGWTKPQYYLTIRLADVNGDKRADICARTAAGFGCWLSDVGGFSSLLASGAMTDEGGWADLKYYSTLRMADVNGDHKADVCARAAVGMFCWISGPSGFEQRITGPAWADSTGWDDPSYYRTIRAFDFDGDGKDDLCARGIAGMTCQASTGTGFSAALAGPPLTDESGWKSLQYGTTIRAAGPRPIPAPPQTCEPQSEVCDGVDNDCDGLIDEQLQCNHLFPDGGTDWDNTIFDDSGAPGDPGDPGDEPEVPASGGNYSEPSGCSCQAVGLGGQFGWQAGGLLGLGLAASVYWNRKRRADGASRR